MSWQYMVTSIVAVSLMSALASLINPAVVDAAAVLHPEQGVKWDVPVWIQPDLSLSHPRVTYTEADVAQARANVDAKAWGKPVLDGIIAQANGFSLTDEQIRRLMPKPFSYYMYLDNFKTCPDGSPMKWAGLNHPGQVYCSGKLFPDAEHPDDGHGWADGKGNTYYFTARWNGAYVELLTGMLEPLALTYSITDKREYAHKVAAILDALATIYPTATEGPLDYPGLRPGFEGGRLERPYYQTARSLLKYVDAADLIWNSGELDVPSATNPELSMRDNIVYNLLLNGADYCYREVHKAGYVDNLLNGTADYNKAILAVGSLLGIDVYVDWAINGPNSFAIMLANNINRDGLYCETTTSYTNYTRTLYMEIAEILYKLRTPSYPKGINMFDNLRFAAFYIKSRELLFVAGHIPLYGDSGVDTATSIRKPFEDEETKQLLRFAVRANDESKSAEYWQLLAGATYPVLAAQDIWGIFNVGSVPQILDASALSVRPSEVAGGTGIALLKSGTDRGVLLRYGPTLNHGHYDELSLLFYTNGQEMSFDPGYSDAHYRIGFTKTTVAHIAGVVDEKQQLSGESAGGSLSFLTAAPGFSVTEACDSSAYAQQGVSMYCRTLALTDTSPKKSYIVDIFRIKGGTVRDYSFHSKGAIFTTDGLLLGASQSGSVASSSYTWHNQIGSDMKIIPYRNYDFYWAPPPGNGYGFLGFPSVATTDNVWSATWSGAGAKVRLNMLPSAGREVIVAEAPSPMGKLKYVLARDNGSEASQFAAVIDMTGDSFQVSAIEPLNTTVLAEGEFSPLAFSLTICDPDLPAADADTQIQDIYLSSLTGLFQAQAGDNLLTTDAEMAMVRMYNAEPAELHVVKGTSLSAGGMMIKGFPAAYTGQIEYVDYANGSILVSSAAPIPDGVVGEYLLVSAEEYSHNSPYRISSITKDGDYYRVELDTDWFDLAKGIVNGNPKGNVLPNSINLPYTRNLSRAGVTSYYDGKLVVNDQGVETRIQKVQGNYAGLIVDSTVGFNAGDNLTIYDIKAGDSFNIPVAVHLSKVDEITYELKSPQPVWLAVPEKYQDLVYVATASGDFTIAQQEVWGGRKMFLVPAGQVVLGATAVLKADPIRQVNGNAPEITASLLDIGNGRPIDSAEVITQINGTMLTFTETTPGVYKTSLPSGLLVGDYQLEIWAKKNGLGVRPLIVTLDAKVDWEILTDNVITVPLGNNHAVIKAAVLTGDQPANDIVMTACVDEQVIPMVAVGHGIYTATIAVKTEQGKITLRAQQKNGYAREIVVSVIYAGGQVVLPFPEVQVKAGGLVTINASFLDGSGVTLKGDAIPEAILVLGMLNIAPFTDEDNDGVATAIIAAPMSSGVYTASIMAEGCDTTTVNVVVVGD